MNGHFRLPCQLLGLAFHEGHDWVVAISTEFSGISDNSRVLYWNSLELLFSEVIIYRYSLSHCSLSHYSLSNEISLPSLSPTDFSICTKSHICTFLLNMRLVPSLETRP